MVYPYLTRISYRPKKKMRNKCHKTNLGNQYLVLTYKKNKIRPQFTCWVYSKKLLLTLLLKNISYDDAIFEGAVCKDCSLTLCTSI